MITYKQKLRNLLDLIYDGYCIKDDKDLKVLKSALGNEEIK